MLMILRKEYQMQVVCELKEIQTTGTNGVNKPFTDTKPIPSNSPLFLSVNISQICPSDFGADTMYPGWPPAFRGSL